MDNLLTVPLDLARLKPESDIVVVSIGNRVIFGGLVREDEGSLKAMEKEFWKEGRCNGHLVKRGSEVGIDGIAIPVSGGKDWLPDADAMDNIDSQAKEAMGVGEVKWFGAAGSRDNPLHAGYRVAGGDWVVGEKDWSWRDALTELTIADASLEVPVMNSSRLFVDEQMVFAKRYADSVMSEIGKIRKGEVYGVVAYTATNGSKTRDEAQDYEVFGYVGKDFAQQALKEAIEEIAVNTSRQVQSGEHFGPVIAVVGNTVVQAAGQGATVAHKVGNLDVVPKEGDRVAVKYGKDGKATVAVGNEQGKAKDRGR